jgi:membrane protein YdbS with pleckstrin-like domain
MVISHHLQLQPLVAPAAVTVATAAVATSTINTHMHIQTFHHQRRHRVHHESSTNSARERSHGEPIRVYVCVIIGTVHHCDCDCDPMMRLSRTRSCLTVIIHYNGCTNG